MNLSSVERISLTSQKASMLMAVALAMPVTMQVVNAGGYGGYASSIAQTEIARRAALVQEADSALASGRTAYADGDYEEAVKQYQTALNLLPSGPALEDRRSSYTNHLGDASLALSQEYTQVGKYNEARNLLEGVLVNDPSNKDVARGLDHLDDPIRTNPALTYEHTQDVDKVRKTLYMAEGYYNLGKYDEAASEYNKVLRVDKYNKAARRGLERVSQTQADYYRAAYDHTRSELLKEVDRAWEMAVPSELPDISDNPTGFVTESGVQYIQDKLNNIILPSFEADDVTLEEVLDQLRLRSAELDTEPDESRKGINFIIESQVTGGSDSLDGGSSSADISTKRITGLNLRNVPLIKVLEYVSGQARLKFKIDAYAVRLLPYESEGLNDLYPRTFIVPPDFIAKLSADVGGDTSEVDDVFGSDNSAGLGGSTLENQLSAKELLLANGISFPDNASVTYISASNTLIANNTLGNLERIEDLITAIRGKGARQVKITCKFIEITQENTDELGFDWVIGSGIGLGDSTLYGGTSGIGNSYTSSDFSNGSDGSGIVTAGNRSGSFAVTSNSIDAIINNPDRSSEQSTVAPGILSLAGVFGEDEVSTIMRGLNQKKGTDIMTAPSILARSGEKATVKVVREFIYPTEYEPPELPSNVGSSSSLTTVDSASTSVFPVTPATPTAFETRNTGVSLEIEPTIGDNNYTIDLRFLPEIVEFEGFINYGSPIQSSTTNVLGEVVPIVITENRIEMPVFAVRSVNTALTIYDGYTVAVGGLMREDVQNVEDKVPLLGDLPIIGRLFQSNSENHIKSNLVVFVTAEIIDPAGMRINKAAVGGGSGSSLLPELPQ